jgi:hypothetical protein
VQSPFGGVVGQADPVVAQGAGEGRPAREHVIERLGQRVVARELGALLVHPDLQLRDVCGAQVLANGQPFGGGAAIDGALDVEQTSMRVSCLIFLKKYQSTGSSKKSDVSSG